MIVKVARPWFSRQGQWGTRVIVSSANPPTYSRLTFPDEAAAIRFVMHGVPQAVTFATWDEAEAWLREGAEGEAPDEPARSVPPASRRSVPRTTVPGRVT
jgi:hypothetical protein